LARQSDIRLHELLGMVALRDGETDIARQHWAEAVELGTTNVAVIRELARLESNAIFSQFNLDYQMPSERAKRLRSLLKRSIECAPAQSMGYEMLAWVEGSVEKPDIPNVNLVQSQFATLNDKPHTLLALILVRYHLGETKAALELLDQLDKFNLNPWSAYCAEVTRARIEHRPVNQAKVPASGPGRPGGNLMPPPMIEPPR
jgi:hypothetical protein